MSRYFFISIFLFLAVGVLFNVLNANNVDVLLEKQMRNMQDLPIAEKMASVSSLLNSYPSKKNQMQILGSIGNERKKVSNPEELRDFYIAVSQRDYDPAVRAFSLRAAAAVLREFHRRDEAQELYRNALAMQPERDLEERTRKMDIQYQVIVEDWFAGRWEAAFQGYMEFAKTYNDISDHKLHIYCYFDALPHIVNRLREQGGRQLIDDAITAGTDSDNVGEKFALAVIDYAMQNNQEALRKIETIANTETSAWWSYLCQSLTMQIHYVSGDYESAKKAFDLMAAQEHYDDLTTRIVGNLGMIVTLFHPKQYGLSLNLYTWFLQSDLYTNEARKESLPEAIVANILENYGIDMLYDNKPADSFRVLSDTYVYYPDTDSGQQAGIILAEHFLKNGEPERAKTLLDRVAAKANNDRELKVWLDLAYAKYYDKIGNEAMKRMYAENVLDIEPREGLEEVERAQYDARGILRELDIKEFFNRFSIQRGTP